MCFTGCQRISTSDACISPAWCQACGYWQRHNLQLDTSLHIALHLKLSAIQVQCAAQLSANRTLNQSCCMQRLHTIRLEDGTTMRLDMRHQTWRLQPDLGPAPIAKPSTQDEVTKAAAHSLLQVPSCHGPLCMPTTAICLSGDRADPPRACMQLCTLSPDARLEPRSYACMQADTASSSMVAQHAECRKLDACEPLQPETHSAIDLTSPRVHTKIQPRVL
jgi:hypothetical protein